MAAILLPAARNFTVPGAAPADHAVAANFAQSDGFGDLVLPGNALPGGVAYPGSSPTPGFSDTAQADWTFTASHLGRGTNTVGGEPLPVADWRFRDSADPTMSAGNTTQFRGGVGQHGPSALGVAQTVALAEIINAPPQPGDLTSILAGFG